MTIGKAFRIIILLCFLSCDDKKQGSIRTEDEILNSIENAKDSSIAFNGQFLKIEKINDRNYNLVLKSESDTIASFVTMMPLNEEEIKLLKKNGNNISLNYINFYNPVTNRVEKIVKYMQPIYEIDKK